jgi:hypothetical protein
MSSILCVTENTLRYVDVLLAFDTLCVKAPNTIRLLHGRVNLTY